MTSRQRNYHEMKNDAIRQAAQTNRLLKEQAERHGLGSKQSLKRLEDARLNDDDSFSFWAELEFIEYCRRRLETTPAMPTSLLINGGARMIGISPVTAKRYISKYSADDGPLTVMRDITMLSAHYVPREQDEYWIENQDEPIPGDRGD